MAVFVDAIDCSRRSFARITAAAISLSSTADADAPAVAAADRFIAVIAVVAVKRKDWRSIVDRPVDVVSLLLLQSASTDQTPQCHC